MRTSGERASKVARRGRRGSREREEAGAVKSLQGAGKSPTLLAEERVHHGDGATLALVPVTANVDDPRADAAELGVEDDDSRAGVGGFAPDAVLEGDLAAGDRLDVGGVERGALRVGVGAHELG